jgi:hypothetical protein
LNPGSYQSDEWGSQVGSQAFPGSFVQLNSPLAHQVRDSLPQINMVWWYLAGAALPVGWDIEPVTRR